MRGQDFFQEADGILFAYLSISLGQLSCGHLQIQEFSTYNFHHEEKERIVEFQFYGWRQNRDNERKAMLFPNKY